MKMDTEVVLGLDIGGTKVLAGLVAPDGTVLSSQTQPVCLDGCEALLKSLCSAGDSLLSAAGNVKLTGIGMAFKGHVDAKNNRLLSSSLLGGKVDFDFCQALTAHFGVPTVIDNDVNAAAIAEMLLDHCGNCFTYINVGTGTAIGVVEDGRLLRGNLNYSGEIGYMILHDPDEDRMFLLEDVASGRGLDQELRRLCPAYPDSPLAQEAANTAGRVSAGRIFEGYAGGDPLAVKTVDHAVQALAEGVLHVHTVTASERYVFGGGVMQPFFFEKLCERVDVLLAAFPDAGSPELVLSTLGTSRVGLLGAACLAMHGCP